MRALVDDAKLAGVTTLVARYGKVVHLDVYGVQDLATKKPATTDTIFRIASMTKPRRVIRAVGDPKTDAERLKTDLTAVSRRADQGSADGSAGG